MPLPVPLPLALSLPGLPQAPLAWSLVLSGTVLILSLVPLAAGRAKGSFSPADLAAPRAMFERLPAWGQRASWAHQNSFEAFGLHAPACLLALIGGADGTAITVAALAHPLLRLAYISAYVGDVAPLRSLCWMGGLLCSALLYMGGLAGLSGS